MATCKYCGKEIIWMKEGRKNIPVGTDGITHACEEFKKMYKSVKIIDPNTLSAEEIKKYEDAINKPKKPVGP